VVRRPSRRTSQPARADRTARGSLAAAYGETILGSSKVAVFRSFGSCVAFPVPPFDKKEAQRMVDEKVKVQRLPLDLADDVVELGINPLVVPAQGDGAVALDALVIPRV
jgi:hypothetical protein